MYLGADLQDILQILPRLCRLSSDSQESQEALLLLICVCKRPCFTNTGEVTGGGKATLSCGDTRMGVLPLAAQPQPEGLPAAAPANLSGGTNPAKL